MKFNKYGMRIAVVMIAVLSLASLCIYIMYVRPARKKYSIINSMKAIAAAEKEFRDKDYDRNGISDFWTADVAGLYEHNLITREMAEADAAPIRKRVDFPIAFNGYLFQAILYDQDGDRYQMDTDRNGAMVKNNRRFGFIAYPDNDRESEKYSYYINESGIVYSIRTNGKYTSRWPQETIDEQVIRQSKDGRPE